MIKLNDGWAIDSDSSQYILGRPTTVMVKDKPTKQMQSATFHATVEQALTCHLRRMQREIVKSSDLTLEESIKAFLKARNEVVNMMGGAECVEG